ncbi:Fic family protein [Candidatus Woesearchaeota archaeon]|nr:Fic family protein [Candidatus Woesearchaeota archaeon]
MVYIDKIKSGKKTFYYLGKTIRIGENKWKKIRIKLGEKEPTREEVGTKLKELRLEEYNLYNQDYLDAHKLEVIDDFKEVYNNHRKTIPKTVVEKEETDFIIRFTYNSNAIEGNRLTLRDTYLIIKEKQIPSGAPPKDYNEAINGREAFEFIKKYKGKLTIEFLEKLNDILTQNTGVVYPGRIRFFPVKIEGAEHIPPEPKEVRSLLKKMIKFYYTNKRKIHPFVLACLTHAQFVEIHPFEDGNGRTGRALMNWILMQAGYPKVFVSVKLRSKYYEAIDFHNMKNIKGYCEKMFELLMEQFKL